MPRIPQAQVEPHQLHGVTKIDNNLTMKERIKKRFRPSVSVEVRNITDQLLYWQWFDEEDEEYSIEDDTNIKIVERGEPGLWMLEGGKTDVIPGSCAYVMIESLFKMICIMKTGIVINPQGEREVRNFSFDDPEAQERIIDLIFVRTLSQSEMIQAALEDGEKGLPILEHLAPLPTEQEEYRQRVKANEALMTRPKTRTADFDAAEAGSTLLGSATGGLPEDRKDPEGEPEAKTEVKPQAEKTAAKTEVKPVKQPETKKEPVTP